MDDARRVCSKHACIQHPDCREAVELCGCPECRALRSATREPAPGDIVALHSGGPDLTVLRVYSDVDSSNGIRVADLGWFTAVGEYRTGTLPIAVLRVQGSSARPLTIGFDRYLDAMHDAWSTLRMNADDYIDRRIDQHIAEALRRAHADLPGT